MRAAPAFSGTDWHAVEQLLAPPFPEIDSESFVPEPSPAMEVSRVTTSPESSLEATTALDRRRVHRTMSAPLMPPPPPRTGDTAPPRAWASRSPAAVVEMSRMMRMRLNSHAVEAPTMRGPARTVGSRGSRRRRGRGSS